MSSNDVYTDSTIIWFDGCEDRRRKNAETVAFLEVKIAILEEERDVLKAKCRQHKDDADQARKQLVKMYCQYRDLQVEQVLAQTEIEELSDCIASMASRMIEEN
tara:strand:- start:249 stop:560 length:312 start_codon:yes stop_codon:yes gene_type:complete